MKLQVIEESAKSKKQLYEESVRARLEKLPLTKIDPMLTAMGRERIKRTLDLLKEYGIDPSAAKINAKIKATIADLGCGMGTLAVHLAEAGGVVTAVDAIEYCELNGIKRARSCIPYIKLPEESFDGVIFTDVIAEIEDHLRRLTLSEISALLKRSGWFLCSTPLDLYSSDADLQFIQLLQTEFEIVRFKKSYHRLFFYLKRWLDAPSRFSRAGKEPEYRLTALAKREGFGRLWFFINSTQPICYLWKPIKIILEPLAKKISQSRKILLFFERLSEFLFGEGALTHIIVLAHKKKI